MGGHSFMFLWDHDWLDLASFGFPLPAWGQLTDYGTDFFAPKIPIFYSSFDLKYVDIPYTHNLVYAEQE